MKKIFVLLVCLWAATASAQTFKRANSGGGFFMPKNAMNSSAQQRQQQQMQRQQQILRQQQAQQTQPLPVQQQQKVGQATDVGQVTNNNTAVVQKVPAWQQKAVQPQKTVKQTPKTWQQAPVQQKTAQTVDTAKKIEQKQSATGATQAVSENRNAAPTKAPVLAKTQKIKLPPRGDTQVNKADTALVPAEVSSPVVAQKPSKPRYGRGEKQVAQTQKVNMPFMFDRIWEDYQADLRTIQLNQKVKNKRLQEVLKDYQDKDFAL